MQREQLILKAVLLLRTVNRYSSKEEQLVMMDKYYSTEQLEDYIEHFHDPKPENSFEELEVAMDDYITEDKDYTPSCTYHDYGPSNPWDAPGMCISDVI